MNNPTDRTYLYANSGVILPTTTPNYGQDEVQAAGGVACRSSVGSGGPYIDAGVIGSQDPYGNNTTAAYGRIVVPLGKRPRRIDCTSLYELEISRLRMELDLARMSMPGGGAPRAVPTDTIAFPSADSDGGS